MLGAVERRHLAQRALPLLNLDGPRLCDQAFRNERPKKLDGMLLETRLAVRQDEAPEVDAHRRQADEILDVEKVGDMARELRRESEEVQATSMGWGGPIVRARADWGEAREPRGRDTRVEGGEAVKGAWVGS